MTDVLLALANLYGAAGRAEELRALLSEHAQRTLSDAGCRRFEVGVAIDDPDHYTLTQEWENLAAFTDYVRGGGFHDLGRRLTGMLTRELQMTLYHVDDSLKIDDIAPMDPRRAD